MKSSSVVIRAIFAAALLALGASTAQATDFRSYGRWLDSNMETYRSINERTGNVYFHDRRETVWRHLDNGRSNAQVSIDGATFNGSVYGYATGPEASDRVEGAISIGIRGARFETTIAGVPYVANRFEGDVVTAHGHQRLDGWSFADGAYTNLRGGFYGHHGNTAAGTLYGFDFDSAGEFHGVFEADR